MMLYIIANIDSMSCRAVLHSFIHLHQFLHITVVGQIRQLWHRRVDSLIVVKKLIPLSLKVNKAKRECNVCF